MASYIAFDFGLKHIGVAVGEDITCTARPLKEIAAQDGIPEWEEIQDLIQHWQPEGLIVGIPLHMDDQEQLLTFSSRKFMNRLKAKYKLPVYSVDERLSSWEAQQIIKTKHGKSRKKNKANVHAIAAALLLEQWFKE